jgi:hypothetical protein
MFYLKSSHHLIEFSLCFQSHADDLHTYKGRKPKWLGDFDKAYKNLIYSMYKNNSSNVVQYFNDVKDYSTLYAQLLLYMKTHCTSRECVFKPYIRIFEKYSHQQDMKHITMLLLYLITIVEPVIAPNIKQTYIKATDEEMKTFTDFHRVQTTDYDYKFLEKVCKYPVNPLVHVFNHTRTDVGYKELIWYNWEYYAYDTPLWRERFNEYGCKKDDNKQEVVFASDDSKETFYEKYGLEPDEQTKTTQNTFITHYKYIPIQTFFSEMWSYNSEVLYSDFLYIL